MPGEMLLAECPLFPHPREVVHQLVRLLQNRMEPAPLVGLVVHGYACVHVELNLQVSDLLVLSGGEQRVHHFEFDAFNSIMNVCNGAMYGVR
jgi:hypothetical protein